MLRDHAGRAADRGFWMALARDIPFSQFPSNDLIRLAAGTLHMGR